MQKALDVLKEAFTRFDRVGLSWSTGKDSTFCLYLVHEVLKRDIPVLFTDTFHHFDATYQFLRHLETEWRLDLHLAQARENRVGALVHDREQCCHYHKTRPFLTLVRELELDAIIVGIRWDEHPSRRGETYFSAREGHVRVHPILHLWWRDILALSREHGVPMNPLYGDGYTSIGCKPCTFPNPSKAAERGGRVQDKETVLDHLRALGYF